MTKQARLTRHVFRRKPVLLLLLAAGPALLTGCFETGGADEDPVGSSGAGPDSAGEPTCDPVSFVPECSAGDIIECSDEGFEQTSGCGPRSTCEVGSEGAACVWRVGEACDGDYEACADPGGILACSDGFWEFEGCPLRGACSDAECFGPEDTPCDPSNSESRCENGELVSCGAHGFEVTSPCGSAEVCEVGTTGAVCVSKDATPCDPETSGATCDEMGRVVSCRDGWTEVHTCDVGDRCFEGPDAATCYAEDTPTCDPTQAPATCEGGVASSCSPFGYEAEQACAADTECLTDETCVFGCQNMAMCVSLDVELCEEPLDLICVGDAIAVCFAGRVLPSLECGCVEDEDGAHCSQDAAGG